MAPLAQELVALKPDALVAGGKPSFLAAQTATRTIPIVIITVDDPVALGLAQSIARPSGNITGTWFDYDALVGKRLEFLQLALPGLARGGHRQPGRSSRCPHDAATADGNARLGYDAGAV
jgi:putative tryptophan/tyrosine transport system substrate-binding protein